MEIINLFMLVIMVLLFFISGILSNIIVYKFGEGVYNKNMREIVVYSILYIIFNFFNIYYVVYNKFLIMYSILYLLGILVSIFYYINNYLIKEEKVEKKLLND